MAIGSVTAFAAIFDDMTDHPADNDKAFDDKTSLAAYRRRIDALDDEIVRLLAQRFEVVREVASLKERYGLPVRIPERIEEVCSRNSDNAAGLGVDRSLVRELFAQIVAASCKLEDQLIDSLQKKP
jgi:chorismate mutase-like protein